MSPIAIEILIAVLTFVVSVGTSMFVAGARWGSMQGDITSMRKEVAEIKGMFVLRLRDDIHMGKE